MKLIAIALALLMSGCAVLQDRKAAVAYAYGGTVADFATTAYKLHEGCRETNPLMNTDTKIAIGALIALGAVYALDKNDSPLWAFWLLGSLHGGAAAYNMTVNCR